MIVVTGATGNIGSRVVAEVRARGVPCRALVRDRAKAATALGSGVELAVGDFADPTSLRAALDGADAVLLSSAGHPRQVEYEANVVDAVAATGGCHVVKISSVGARPGSPASFIDWHGRSEEALARSSLPATVLRSSFFMSNLLMSAGAVARAGQLVAPAGEARIAMVHPGDVAAAAATVLTEPGHVGSTYELSGPEALTYAEVAGVLTEVLGRPVEFFDAPDAAVREALLASAMPPWFVAGFLDLFAELRAGVAATTTGTVEALTGRRPRPLADFVVEHAQAFASSGTLAGVAEGR